LENKITDSESQGVCHQDELIGHEVNLTLTVISPTDEAHEETYETPVAVNYALTSRPQWNSALSIPSQCSTALIYVPYPAL
jgi:hypothetical protein